LAFVPQPKKVEVIEASPDRLDVRGALTFATARFAYEAGLRALRKNGASNGRNGAAGAAFQVDCAGVTESDSAGLAVLIEWLAAGERLGRKVHFSNLPDGIRAAAQISDVSALLEPTA
jgi:phospholipid transport system transporter-binding protein